AGVIERGDSKLDWPNTGGEYGIDARGVRHHRVPPPAQQFLPDRFRQDPIQLRCFRQVREHRNTDPLDVSGKRVPPPHERVAASGCHHRDCQQRDSDRAPHFTTTLTSLPFATMTLTIVLPSKCGRMAGAASAAASMSGSAALASTTMRPRTLPLTCTGISTLSSRVAASSHPGQPAATMPPAWPRRS